MEAQAVFVKREPVVVVVIPEYSETYGMLPRRFELNIETARTLWTQLDAALTEAEKP